MLKSRFRDISIEVVPIATEGDKGASQRSGAWGAKGAFTRDIESKLLAGDIDVAVHSMKDIPNDIPQGLVIAATPRRDDPRDCLLSTSGAAFRALPARSRVGTGSLRRKSQLVRMRSDIEVVGLVGNVDTRIKKLTTGYDAIVLALAGLRRIGQENLAAQIFSTEEMVPAICQGILALEVRSEDSSLRDLLSNIEDKGTRTEADCERAFSKALGADCNVPVGGIARVKGESMSLIGLIANEDGTVCLRREAAGPSSRAADLGKELAHELLEAGGRRILTGVAS
jgi:hydroxymethylbilane synthase